MLGHIASETATELSYIKRSSYMKDVTSEKNWTFELGVGDSIDVPIYVKVGFMLRDQFSQQHQNVDTYYKPSLVNPNVFLEMKNSQMQK